MVSKVQICNRALLQIGHTRQITSFEEDCTEAKVCKALYEETKKATLRDYPWHFALKLKKAVRVAETPLFKWNYAYQKPDDLLRLFRTYPRTVDFAIVGDKIMSNVEPFQYVGIFNVSEDLFDASFVEALSLKLAAELAIPVASSSTLHETFYNAYQRFIKDARTTAAYEQSGQTVDVFGFLEARL